MYIDVEAEVDYSHEEEKEEEDDEEEEESDEDMSSPGKFPSAPFPFTSQRTNPKSAMQRWKKK